MRYFAFGTPEAGTNIGQTAVTDEPFTKAYFEQIEKLAPYWDATDPDLRGFARAGGKLILWQGEADWSIPTVTSIAYYQAVVKAMGGLWNTQQFAKYYLLPSVGHCGGNGPDTYDGLGAVVAWTEKHISPNALVATEYAPATQSGGPGGPGGPGGGSTSDLTDAVPTLGAPASTAAVRSINLYPYPELPAYNGYGTSTTPRATSAGSALRCSNRRHGSGASTPGRCGATTRGQLSRNRGLRLAIIIQGGRPPSVVGEGQDPARARPGGVTHLGRLTACRQMVHAGVEFSDQSYRQRLEHMFPTV